MQLKKKNKWHGVFCARFCLSLSMDDVMLNFYTSISDWITSDLLSGCRSVSLPQPLPLVLARQFLKTKS